MPSTARNRLQGLTTSVAVKPPCITVATSNITLSGLQTVSDVTVTEGDRVLVKGQTAAEDNGIYNASTGSWTRALDFDGDLDAVSGTRILVRSGGSNAIEYELTTADPIVIGTTELTFTLRYGANAVYDRTETEIAAGVVPVNYTIPSHDAIGTVLVDRYGTNTTPGTTNMFTAIQNAIKVALTGDSVSGIGDHARVTFLRGVYAISGDGVLNLVSLGLQRGIIFEGQGLASTVLKLITGGSAKYFYKNTTTDTQQFIFVTFQDLMLTSDSSTYGNGFYFQQDQGWRWFRVWFQTLARCIEGNGNTSGSEHKFYSCKFTDIHDRVISFDNNQMLNVELHGCDVESIYGHIFYVDDGGGGALGVYGGSFIMDALTDKYLLYIQGDGQGSNNNRFNFNGIQTELHTVGSKLVFKGSGGTSAVIVFNDCHLSNTQGGTRELVNITGGRITFRGGSLNATDTYTIQTSGGGISFPRHGDPGSLVLDGVALGGNISKKITTGAYGYASARGCFMNEYAPATNTKVRAAMDFDLNWMNGTGRASNFPGLKTVSGKVGSEPWPHTDDTYDWTVTLPDGALIKNIYVYRPAHVNGGAGSYELKVGNGDKSAEYGDDGGGLVGTDAHTITIERDIDNLIACGTSTPGTEVRVWADPSTTGVADGGYFIVQYF